MIKAKDLEKMNDEQRADLNLVSKSKYCQFIEKAIDEGYPTREGEIDYILGMINFAKRFRLLTNEEISSCHEKLDEATRG